MLNMFFNVHGSFAVESVPYPTAVPPAAFDAYNQGAVVVWSTIFWGHASGFGYWDRLFGMFATAFVNASELVFERLCEYGFEMCCEGICACEDQKWTQDR